MARPVEAGHLQSELEGHRILLLPHCGVRCGQESGRDERYRAGRVDAGESLAGERLEGRGALAQLRGHDLARHRRAPRPVALAHDGVRRVEDDGMGGHAVLLGQRAPLRPSLRLEAGRIDHRRKASPAPFRHDQVEYLEGVAARTLVALAGPDRGAQPIG
jgi:hypothetical protein